MMMSLYLKTCRQRESSHLLFVKRGLGKATGGRQQNNPTPCQSTVINKTDIRKQNSLSQNRYCHYTERIADTVNVTEEGSEHVETGTYVNALS